MKKIILFSSICSLVFSSLVFAMGDDGSHHWKNESERKPFLRRRATGNLTPDAPTPAQAKQQPRGIDVVVQFTQRTGRVLPHDFWTYYSDWCNAWRADNQQQMQALRNHPNAAQYSAWIDDVKRVFNNN